MRSVEFIDGDYPNALQILVYEIVGNNYSSIGKKKAAMQRYLPHSPAVYNVMKHSNPLHIYMCVYIIYTHT